MGRTLNEDDVLKEIDRWIGYLDEDMITRIKIGIKKLQSAQPSVSDCWGCNCPKMERLKEQKTFSEMVHLHDAETRDKCTETHACDCIDRQAAIEALMAWEEYSVWDEECLKHRGEQYWVAPSDVIKQLPPAQPEHRWIPCSELPSDNREVEVTCEVRRCDGKRYRYTCHASYVHKYTIESTDYCDWEEADEYNEDEDKYYALPGWYERVHNWDDYSFIAIADFVTAWRELPEPYREEGEDD